ncbi:MAG: cupin domain-containing protein [Solirubrobacteraceae bacterium]
MPVTSHWDDARSTRADVGPMGADWDRLGDAAGCKEVGLRRIHVSAGKQSTPVHAHYGEEEIFYVLGGSGVSWQEDGAYAIGAGDVVLHPPGGRAHTVVAGENGIDLLAFGENMRGEAVRFPRIDAAWVGGMVLDAHPVHQFQLEAERAGPVEVPAQLSPRPDTIVNVEDVEPVALQRDAIDAQARFLTRALGARRTALNHTQLAPGSESAPPHCHSAIEELFVVLEGDGALLLGAEEQQHPLRAGSLVSRPAGSGVAHCFRSGPSGMTLLMYSDQDPNDMCFYPRTGKVSIRGLGVIFRPERVGYWDD